MQNYKSKKILALLLSGVLFAGSVNPVMASVGGDSDGRYRTKGRR